MTEQVDVAVVGAGAAGLMAAIWARRTARAAGDRARRRAHARREDPHRGRRTLQRHARRRRRARLRRLVAGRRSARCCAASTCRETVAFFASCGVTLKREETGKLFPVTDRARTVLDALLRRGATRRASSSAIRGACGDRARRRGDSLASTGAAIAGARGSCSRPAAGACPKSGSDGARLRARARARPHRHPRTFPALVPLTLPRRPLPARAPGLSAPATLEVRAAAGRRAGGVHGRHAVHALRALGPGVLDVSRHWTDARARRPGRAARRRLAAGHDRRRARPALRAPARGRPAVLRDAPARAAGARALRAAGVDGRARPPPHARGAPRAGARGDERPCR